MAVPITTGATSGTMTEMVSGEVTPGMPLIVEAVSKGQIRPCPTTRKGRACSPWWNSRA